MRPKDELKQSCRLNIINSSEDGFAAHLVYPNAKLGSIAIIASWGEDGSMLAFHCRDDARHGKKCV